MLRSRVAITTAAVVALTGGLLARQTPQKPAPPPAQPSFAASTTAILVDVVVRDRKGRPVTGLTAADFEIREDGAPQTIGSFSQITRGGGIGVGVAWKRGDVTSVRPGGAAAADPASAPEETSTALVFDHLSSESLRLAQRATLGYIPMSGESGARVGVFATDPGLHVVQPYTTDRGLVRQAVAAVVPSGTSAEEQKAERNDELTGRRRQLQGEVQAAVAGAVGGSSAALARNAAELGRRETELRMIQTELNMIRSFDNLDRDHRGYDTAAALLAVVRSLAERPGRKTVVFFSEGLPVSPALSARLDLVIDAANRANVTAYAIDANGLRAKSNLTAAGKELQAFAEERIVQTTSGSDRTDQPLTMALERVQDTLMLDSRSGLARLADQTGGFLMEQSNDLSSAFRRIDEDNQFHYLLTYSPTNLTFDGRFRTIQVKVRRPGMQVFSRKGYRAARRPGAIDAGGYESPALALLDRTPLPNAFPVHAAGFSFPEPSRPGLAPIVVRLTTAALHFD
ncbi:MAG: VWA domain-containing protein, partial [Acidobacteriota bacterium]